MKLIKYLILSFAGILLSTGMRAQELRLMTYNIRFANKADHPHTWEARRPLILDQISTFDPDIIGFQEALLSQVLDLEIGLGNHLRFGVGRDDGKNAGEFSPLFYRSDRFELTEGGTLWLSETPEKISIGWDAALPRIATWAILKDQNTGNQFMVINTHFDHIGEIARLNSIQLLHNFIEEEVTSGIIPILMGDLNTGPNDEPYKWLMDQEILSDSFYEAKHRVGPVGTFNAFNYAHQSDRIDYIFVDPSMKVKQYKVLMESHNGVIPSDHWPVMVIAETK